MYLKQSQSLRAARRFVLPLLLIGLIATLSQPLSALAAVRACRADPIVRLSDGRVVQMTASIAANATRVTMITYTLHVPKGVTAKRIVYTGGALKSKERVVLVADLREDTYGVKTLALITGDDVAMKATSRVGGESETVKGRTGEALRAHFDLTQ